MKGCIAFTLLGLALLTMLSCAGTKEFPKAQKASMSEVLSGMADRQIDYQYFSGKAKVKFEGQEMSVGGRANVRMIKDSLIWMNFKKISIEGSRALITQDSFWIVYRLDKMYESGTFEELMEAYDMNITFSELQNLLIGNLPIPKVHEVNQLSTKKVHNIRFNQNGTRYEYELDGAYFIRSSIISDILGRRIVGAFADYNEKGFSQTKDFSVSLEDGNSGRVTIDFSDVEFDVPKTIIFDVPSDYYKLP
jgi:hypothetical protein